MLEPGLVILVIQTTDGIDVDVVVIQPMVVAVDRLEQCRVVVPCAWLVSTRKIAHQPTTKSHMVTG